MSEQTSSHQAYGCLFCMSGTEEIISRMVHYKHPEVRICPATYDRFRFRKGMKTQHTAIFMPGYVFYQAEPDIMLPYDFPRDRGFRMLRDESGDWRLRGRDRKFVQWLFQQDCHLKVSEAYMENDQVRIRSGPMKDLEGSIEKIDRSRRCGLTRIEFHGKVFRIWLSFDLLTGKDEAGDA